MSVLLTCDSIAKSFGSRTVFSAISLSLHDDERLRLTGTASVSSVVVTDDRYFLENCATRVAEINRAYPLGLFAAPGNYSKFLEKRSEFLRAQAKEQQALENLVQREIEWLRRGAKARTSKSKARIDDAFALQDQLP